MQLTLLSGQMEKKFAYSVPLALYFAVNVYLVRCLPVCTQITSFCWSLVNSQYFSILLQNSFLCIEVSEMKKVSMQIKQYLFILKFWIKFPSKIGKIGYSKNGS